MTKEEAINVLDVAVSVAPLTRMQHNTAIQALNFLRQEEPKKRDEKNKHS